MNKKFTVYTFTLVILIWVIASSIFYKIEYENKPRYKEEIIPAPYLYNFYVPSNPVINEPYYGSPGTSITMVAFLDVDSEASKFFIKDILPNIKKNYIDKGAIKFYHKNYVTLEDIENKNNNFKYSLILSCIKKLKQENYYDFYFDLFSTSNIKELIKKYNIPIKEYNDCVSKKNLDQIHADALEVENLGIIAINQRFYIGIAGRDNTVFDGIPKYVRFQKAIRQYEIQVGN